MDTRFDAVSAKYKTDTPSTPAMVMAIIRSIDNRVPGQVLCGVEALSGLALKGFRPQSTNSTTLHIIDVADDDVIDQALHEMASESVVDVVSAIASSWIICAITGKTADQEKSPPLMALAASYGAKSTEVRCAFAAIVISTMDLSDRLAMTFPSSMVYLANKIVEMSSFEGATGAMGHYIRQAYARLDWALGASVKLCSMATQAMQSDYFGKYPIFSSEFQAYKDYRTTVRNAGVQLRYAGWCMPSPIPSSSIAHLAELVRACNAHTDSDFIRQRVATDAVIFSIRTMIDEFQTRRDEQSTVGGHFAAY